MTDTENQKHRVQSAARAVDILRNVAEADANGISASDLSRRLGIPRQVVYHLTHTLAATQMLRKVGRGSYALGVGVAPLVQGFRRQMSSDYLAGYCRLVAAETGEAAYVSGWVNDEIVVLASAPGNATIQVAEVPLGTAGDAHARASGKLLLAMSSEADVRRYLADHPLTPRTANTCKTSEELSSALEKIRGDGWISKDLEEFAPGMSCMAVPVPSVPSQLVLGISMPSYRFRENEVRYAEVLKRIARDGI